MPVFTLFGQPPSPAALTSDNTAYTFGVQFTVSQAATLTGIWWFSAPGAVSLPTMIALFAVSGRTLVHSEVPAWSGIAGSGWVRAPFSSPPALASATSYKAGALGDTGGGGNWYPTTAHYWDTGPGSGGITSGPLSAPNNAGGDGGQDTFNMGGILTYPATLFNASNYWIDPEVTTVSVAGQVQAVLDDKPHLKKLLFLLA